MFTSMQSQLQLKVYEYTITQLHNCINRLHQFLLLPFLDEMNPALPPKTVPFLPFLPSLMQLFLNKLKPNLPHSPPSPPPLSLPKKRKGKGKETSSLPPSPLLFVFTYKLVCSHFQVQENNRAESACSLTGRAMKSWHYFQVLLISTSCFET